MDAGSIVVYVLRLAVPLSILRYPLGGVLASIILDSLDQDLVYVISGDGVLLGGSLVNYQLIDKLLDIYYLSFAFFVSLKWPDSLPQKVSLTLFSLRVFGVVLFELTQARVLLFVAPNVFELFYLYYTICRKWFPRGVPTSRAGLAIVLLATGIPKLGQEYLQHVKDSHTTDIVDFLTPLHPLSPSAWQWVRDYCIRSRAC